MLDVISFSKLTRRFFRQFVIYAPLPYIVFENILSIDTTVVGIPHVYTHAITCELRLLYRL